MNMDYISERITNISDLEKLLWNVQSSIQMLIGELHGPEPSLSRAEDLANCALESAAKAHEFEFCIEHRKVASDQP
jgi:hypothetical protein